MSLFLPKKSDIFDSFCSRKIRVFLFQLGCGGVDGVNQSGDVVQVYA